MARVYRATHVEHGTDVALKVMTGKIARNDKFRRAFAAEVDAIAQLSHPGIVDVFDAGVVSESEAASSDGWFETGVPYLAMELVADGTLSDHRFALDFAGLKTVLLALLDALAHSHARGILHRDLKPANVLVREDHGMLFPVLTDFGISHVMEDDPKDRSTLEETIAGTPAYMAPEQALGLWRQQGPWTDLYAVGVIAWELVTHSKIFGGGETEVLQAQVSAPLPRFVPRIDLPDGFAPWLYKMLAKRTKTRFRRAADAAHNLRKLEAPGGQPTSATSFAASLATLVELDANDILAAFEADDEDDDPTKELVMWPKPPIPRSWRQVRYAPEARATVGKGLFNVRSVPVVGREDVRAALWNHLRDCRRTKAPSTVVLEAPAGLGRTRIAEWLAHRTHEVGATTVLRMAQYDEHGVGGLEGMVATWARCTGLSRADTFERLAEAYEHVGLSDDAALFDVGALTDLIRPTADVADSVRFGHATELHAAVLRLVQRLTRERSVLIIFDDAHLQLELLPFIELLMNEPRTADVLVLLTTLPDAPGRARIVAGASSTYEMAPLSDDEQSELLTSLLPIDRAVCTELVHRAGGSPLFGVQLLANLVERDLLVSGSEGLTLAPGAEHQLPAGIEELWLARLDTIRRDLIEPEKIDRILYAAAAMGSHIAISEWAASADHLDAVLPTRLIELLVRHGLASRSSANQLILVSESFRLSVVRRAQVAGLWSRVNAACAAGLRSAYPQSSPRNLARMAAHHLEAGDPSRAADDFAAAIEGFASTDQIERVVPLVRRFEEAAEAARLPQYDRRRASVDRWMGAACRVTGEDDATDWLLRALDGATLGKGPSVVTADFDDRRSKIAVGTLIELGAVASEATGGLDQALTLLDNAADLARRCGDLESQARSLASLAEALARTGQLDEALKSAQRAVAVSAEVGERALARACVRLSLVHWMRGDLVSSQAAAQQAVEISERIGWRGGQASATLRLAEIARIRGDFATARRQYQAVHRLDQLRGNKSQHIAVLNLASIDFEEGRYHQRRQELEAAMKLYPRLAMDAYLVYAHALVLVPCSEAGELDEARGHIDEVEAALQRQPLVDRDLARPLELAGQILLARDDALARRALTLAVGQYTRLGMTDRVRALGALLGNQPGPFE